MKARGHDDGGGSTGRFAKKSGTDGCIGCRDERRGPVVVLPGLVKKQHAQRCRLMKGLGEHLLSAGGVEMQIDEIGRLGNSLLRWLEG